MLGRFHWMKPIVRYLSYRGITSISVCYSNLYDMNVARCTSILEGVTLEEIKELDVVVKKELINRASLSLFENVDSGSMKIDLFAENY